jgi:hypothetical protein
MRNSIDSGGEPTFKCGIPLTQGVSGSRSVGFLKASAVILRSLGRRMPIVRSSILRQNMEISPLFASTDSDFVVNMNYNGPEFRVAYPE